MCVWYLVVEYMYISECVKPQILLPRDITMGPAYYDVTHVGVFM